MLGTVPFALTAAIALDLWGVMVFDAGDELAQHIDELRRGLIGEARQVKGQDERFAFHRSGGYANRSEALVYSSSSAACTCSAVTCFALASAAAESA